MGRWVWLVVFSLLTAACGGNGSAAPTSSASTSSSSTVATIATTTTTESIKACEPTPLEGRPRVWEQGCIYTAHSFAVPLTLTAPGAGWTSHGAADRWVELRHDADGDGRFDVSITLIAYEADSTPGSIADALVSIEGVDLIDGPLSTVVQSSQALVADLLGQELPIRAGTGLPEPCTIAEGTAFFFTDGYQLFRDPERPNNAFVGIPACYKTRAWIIDVSGTSVTALGVVKDNDRFEQLMPIIEDFLQNSVTFGASDG